jgi:segregation and condensation protein B
MVPEENLPEEREAAPIAEPPQLTEATEVEPESMSAEDLLPDEPAVAPPSLADAQLKAVLEAIVYITDEPLTLDQICAAIEQPRERVIASLEQLSADYEKDDRGLSIREIAGGFKMTTKAEHHEAVRRFVKNLNPPLKLSLPALETLAVIAYKQPITAPEIMEIRGVQGAGVLKTLIDRKLIATAGRKQVVGKPILYKTTREFLVQFGLRDVGELPSLKEFQEIGRMDTETAPEPTSPAETSEPLPPIEEPQTELPLSDPPVDPEEETPGEPTPVQEPPPES